MEGGPGLGADRTLSSVARECVLVYNKRCCCLGKSVEPYYIFTILSSTLPYSLYSMKLIALILTCTQEDQGCSDRTLAIAYYTQEICPMSSVEFVEQSHNRWMQYTYLCRVSDPHHFNADPDPAFHFNADPNTAYHQGDANLRPLASRPPFWVSKDPEFWL